jgi:hypothetical protein
VDSLTQVLITAGASITASSGFWAWFSRRADKKSATTQLLLGLAHDRIIFLGMGYIKKGWISKDEYDDFMKYLYGPYSEFGGNGLAEKVMAEVSQLPFHQPRRKRPAKTETQNEVQS